MGRFARLLLTAATLTGLAAWLVIAPGSRADPPPAVAPVPPIDPATLRVGHAVYMVWNWGREPRVIACRVAHGSTGINRTGLRLEWPDEDEGGTNWTAVDATVVVYATERAAKRHAATILRTRAADLLRKAEELEK